MANPDLTRLDERKVVIDEIEAEENVSRKRYEQRKFDIYRNRQMPYVLERLCNELSLSTVQRMRKVLSINPCKRIVDQMGSLYVDEPERTFSNASDQDKANIELLYTKAMVDPNMRLANRYFKLHDQSALWVVPMLGKVMVRAMTPKDYDVIPDDRYPEKAFAYVLNVWDLDMRQSAKAASSLMMDQSSYYFSDQLNQKIADDSDRKKKQGRYVFWTDEMHFVCNRDGEIVEEAVINPIGRLPFIDLACEKDFQFFVRRGNNIAEFTVDLLSQLSDIAEVSRLQGYSQAVISSVEEPKDIVVGPTKVIWLKQDPNSPKEPKFEFVSPSPDLGGSLEILNTQLKMFLTSQGLDAGTVSGKSDARAFTSGVDHLLANIDKFRASKEDTDLFRLAEHELFELMRSWSNIMQPVTDEMALDEDLRFGQISEDIELSICFEEPHSVQTQSEKEDSVIKRLDAKLITKKQALMELYDLSPEAADEMIQEINQESEINLTRMQGLMNEASQNQQDGNLPGDRPQAGPGGGSGGGVGS